MDVNKKFLFVNPAASNEDEARMFPLSSLRAFHMDNTDSLIVTFDDAGTNDHTTVDITITDGLGQTVIKEFVEAINFSKDAVIVLANNADDSSVSANIDFATAPTITDGSNVTSVTATDDGTGTGTIPEGATFVAVNADSDANHIVILPSPVVGTVLHIAETGTTGFELRTSAPASIGINAGTGSNAESAIAGATTLVRCVCVSATNWVASQFDADGDESKVEQAA
tara:strand:- start:66 stop:743 length:678 start_codon:yes stop_codon:yes gene_type:complete